jgi:hypothetical protein
MKTKLVSVEKKRKNYERHIVRNVLYVKAFITVLEEVVSFNKDY